MSNAETAYGITLHLHDGGTPGSYTEIAETVDFPDLPGIAYDMHDKTTTQSTDGMKEFVPTLGELEEFSVTIQFLDTDATHNSTTGLLYLAKNRTLRKYKFVDSNGTTTLWEFYAYVRRFKPGAPKGGVRTAQITFRPTGQYISTI